jgi:proton-dependent oligopeptide transporter, POT family
MLSSFAVWSISLFTGFYAATNVGVAGAISGSFIARDQGYWAAFLVPTCLFVIVLPVIVLGRKKYVVTPPRGSIIIEVNLYEIVRQNLRC